MSVAADYRGIANRVRAAPPRLSRAAAQELQRALEARIRADTGDGTLSGTRRRGQSAPKLDVTVRLSGSTAVVTAGPARAAVIWGWLEQGTGTRHMPKTPMRIGGQWRTGPWTSSGTRAKRTYSQGIERGIPAADRAIDAEWARVVG